MTESPASAPTTIPRPDARRPRFLGREIGTSLGDEVGLLADAFRLAYVDPYAGRPRRPQIVADDDLDGRDPSW